MTEQTVIESQAYTIQLSAGLGLIEETKILLELWSPEMTPSNLRKVALDSGRFSNVSAQRLRNIIERVFKPRFLSNNGTPATYLKLLEEGLTRSERLQLYFLYTCRANRVLGDFVREVYWPKYSGGAPTISKEDARRFINRALDEGRTADRWSEGTAERVTRYILGACADFELLSTRTTNDREIRSVVIEQKTLAYVAHDLHFRGLGDNSIIAHEDWNLFGLDSDDVRNEFQKLTLTGMIVLQVAGLSAQVSWKVKSMENLIDVLAQQ
jgi:hypothetical protein